VRSTVCACALPESSCVPGKVLCLYQVELTVRAQNASGWSMRHQAPSIQHSMLYSALCPLRCLAYPAPCPRVTLPTCPLDSAPRFRLLLIHPTEIRAPEHVSQERQPEAGGHHDHPSEGPPRATFLRGTAKPKKQRARHERDRHGDERLCEVNRALIPSPALSAPEPWRTGESQPHAPEHQPSAEFGQRAFHPSPCTATPTRSSDVPKREEYGVQMTEFGIASGQGLAVGG